MSEEKIVIRSYPKVISLLPTAILAIIFGIVETLPFIGTNELIQRGLGLAFIIVFIFNIFILAFEFNEAKTFGLIGIIILLALIYLLLSQMNIIAQGSVFNVISGTRVILSAHAYYLIGFGILFVMFLIWIHRRWDYWIIEPNQVTHKSGIFGKIERFPTQGMKYGVEISDIFEYMLFKSGKLTLYFPTEKKIITLSVVPGIKHIEKRIQEILGFVEVE